MNYDLKDILTQASRDRWATGHFNVSELDQMKAVVEVCAALRSPAIIGTSEGEREHFGLEEVVALRDVLRAKYDIPIFLNADHSKSVSSAQKAIDAGYDSVHIDLSKLPLEENIKGTKTVVEYARARSLSISVEGEVGYFITDSSKVYQEEFKIPSESLTKPEEAKRYVAETGVDRFAPAVGNLHGIAASVPHLDFARIKKIREALPSDVVLVLHGGSGIEDADFKRAIEEGIANIHISTALRVAFINAFRETLKDDLDEAAMYKLDKDAIEAFKKEIEKKLILFGSVNRV